MDIGIALIIVAVVIVFRNVILVLLTLLVAGVMYVFIGIMVGFGWILDKTGFARWRNKRTMRKIAERNKIRR